MHSFVRLAVVTCGSLFLSRVYVLVCCSDEDDDDDNDNEDYDNK